MSAPALYHYSAKPFTGPVECRQQDGPSYRTDKPWGLWVTTEGEDDWPSWCRMEGFNLDALEHRQRIVLSPVANLLWLRSVADIDQFTADYGVEATSDNWYRGIRWHDVAKDYPGILIAPYQWARRLDDGAGWYYSWDCASGCIWAPSAIAEIVAAPALAEMVSP